MDLIGFILEVLQSFGTQPSLDKTVVLMQLKGGSAARIRRQHVTKHPKLGMRLCVRTAQGRIELPLVEQHTYLGVKISYGHSEAATVRYRVQQSWKVFNRLLPSLRSTGLPQNMKLAVWRACAYACLMYGLDCVILPPQSAQKLQQAVVRQLRIMLKSPVFITREPAELFRRRLGIPSPAVDVANRIRARVSKCRQGPMKSLQPLRTQQRWRNLDEAAALSQEYAAIPVWQHGSTNADTQARLQEVHVRSASTVDYPLARLKPCVRMLPRNILRIQRSPPRQTRSGVQATNAKGLYVSCNRGPAYVCALSLELQLVACLLRAL